MHAFQIQQGEYTRRCGEVAKNFGGCPVARYRILLRRNVHSKTLSIIFRFERALARRPGFDKAFGLKDISCFSLD